jgi:ribosomal protein S14
MLLKEKYNSNHLIKQKRFMLLGPSMLGQYLTLSDFKKIKNQKNYQHQRDNKYTIYSSKSQKQKSNPLKILNTLLNINKYPFLEHFQRFKYKQIHTYFRNIISDQKKRASFAKNELRKTLLKMLLSANQRSFLFTRKTLFLDPSMKMLESLPIMFHKVELKDVSQFFPQRNNTKRLVKLKNTFKQKTFGINESSSNQYAILGPILFLENTINPQFTDKIKGFSRIRNRCLLSGRSTIVGKYRLSRICFRYYANCGLIPGLTKNRK